MERKSFLGLTIGALIGIILLFVIYFLFFRGTETGQTIRNTVGGFFPVGDTITIPGIPDSEDVPGIVDGQTDQPLIIPKLRRLSLAPAAGYIAFDRATTTTTIVGTSTVSSSTVEMAVRYIEKSTGHIYEASDLGFNVPRLSNTTLGIFDEATFSNNQSFVARVFNPDTSLVDTYIGSLIRNATTSTTTSPFRTSGSYYPRNPDSVTVRGTSLFAFYEYPLNSEGFLTQIAPVRETKVFSSPLSGWNAEWINKDSLLLTTKANAGYDGYAYTYNPVTKRMNKVLGPTQGLTAKVNTALTAGLYTESYRDHFAFYMANFRTNTVIQLSSATLPEKCVFSTKNPMIAYCAVPRPLPQGSYPEDWYKGNVSFDDAIVKIDIENNIEIPIVNLSQEGGVLIDAINLTLNERENFLVFQNKRDGFVWSYDLR